jgi:SAM-dependent methyltransferase
MFTKDQILQELESLKTKYGEWTYDIPLPYNIWTCGNLNVPHTRLKRLFQCVNDISNKPISECRILDLGCLDGMFSIEFALHGAETIGVEIREANIKKAIFCKEVLGLENLEFRQDDVRNISVETYGKFDAIICSGILYHLPGIDAINLINKMYEMTEKLVIIDTHISIEPIEKIEYENNEYSGCIFREHSDHANSEDKEKRLWASADNTFSFWFTRPSLINILNKVGFSSVYECFTPIHINFGNPGFEHQDRCTIVAIKGKKSQIRTSPSSNDIQENWPENRLSYNLKKSKSFCSRIFSKIKRILKLQ